MPCELDYRHASIWCDSCYEESQRAETVQVQRSILDELIKFREMAAWGLNSDEMNRFPREYQKRPYYPPIPAPPAKPEIQPIKRRGL